MIIDKLYKLKFFYKPPFWFTSQTAPVWVFVHPYWCWLPQKQEVHENISIFMIHDAPTVPLILKSMDKMLCTFFLYQYIFETTVWKGFSSWVDKRELLHLRSFFMGFHVVKRMLEGYTTYQVMIVFLSPFFMPR